MGIYTARYERYKGPLEPPGTRFLVIAEAELRRLYKEKWIRRLFILAWGGALVLAVLMYVHMVVGNFIFGETTSSDRAFVYLFKVEVVFIAIMLAAFGSSMIARDVTNRSLTLYFTRPIDVDQYLWGKLLAVLCTVFGVTLAPGLMLAGAQLLMSKQADVLHFLNICGRLLAASVVAGGLVSTMILLLSSLGRSPRYVGFAWLAIWIFLFIVRGVLSDTLGHHELLDLISLSYLFVQAAEYILMGDRAHLSSMIATLLLTSFFYFSLRVRLQALERAQT